MAQTETATLGGGCFWCVEAVYQRVKGIESVKPGYAGGHTKNPTYKEICTGKTGHAEVAQIKFNKNIITYEQILNVFWQSHDPTTLNRQGNDVGSQYRSAIFFNNLEEKIQIQNCIDRLQNEKAYDNPIVTEVNTESTFYEAEVDHHNYFNQNRDQPYCQFVITPKIKKFESLFNQHTTL